MQQFSPTIAALFAAGTVDTFFMVRVYDKNGVNVFTTTTHHNNVTLTDGRTFEANDLLVGADPPQLSTTVDREQYSITIADPEFLQGSLLENGMVGKRMEVLLGFLNPVTGLPYTNPADTFTVYRGRCDGGALKVDTREYGEVLARVVGVSPIMSLEKKKGILLSRDAVRQRNASDSCCDQLYEGSSAVVLKWGKA